MTPTYSGDAERGPGDRGHHAGAQELLGPGVQRVPAGVQQQRGRFPQHQQRRGHHEQQQVLDHVIPEQDVVIAADAALGRDDHDGQAAEEQRGPPQRPRAGRMPVPDPQHAPQVQGGHENHEAGYQRRELPAGDQLGQARRGQRVLVHAAEITPPSLLIRHCVVVSGAWPDDSSSRRHRHRPPLPESGGGPLDGAAWSRAWRVQQRCSPDAAPARPHKLRRRRARLPRRSGPCWTRRSPQLWPTRR